MKPFVLTLGIGTLAIFLFVYWTAGVRTWTPHDEFPDHVLRPDEVWVRPKGLFDDRQLRFLQVLQLAERPEVVTLGSSRANSVSAFAFGPHGRFLNLWVGSASLEDIIAFWQLLKAQRKTPHHLIVFMDPVTYSKKKRRYDILDGYWDSFEDFTGNQTIISQRTVANDLGTARYDPIHPALKRRDREPWIERIAEASNLFSWEGVRVSFQCLMRKKSPGQHAMILPRQKLPPEWTAYANDGSLLQPPIHRSTIELVDLLNQHYGAVPTAFGFHDWAPDPEKARLCERWIRDVKRFHTRLTLVIPPYHPIIYRRLVDLQHDEVQSFLETLQSLDSSRGQVHVCNAMNPQLSGCRGSDFLDSVHLSAACSARVINTCLAGETW